MMRLLSLNWRRALAVQVSLLATTALGCGDDVAPLLTADDVSDVADVGDDIESDGAELDASFDADNDAESDGTGDAAADDATADDTTDPSDTEAPSVRDVRAAITGAYAREFAVDTDRFVTVPWQQDVTFTVFAQDNQSDADALDIEILLDDERAVVSATEFRNGLSLITIAMAPGQVATMVVTDEAGNATPWPHSLTFVGADEAIIGEWQMPVFDAEQSLVTASSWSFSDGMVSISSGDSTRTSTFEVVPATAPFELPTLRRTANPDTPSPSTSVQAVAFVDDLALIAPYLSSSETLEGLWIRAQQQEGFADGDPVTTVIEDRIEIRDDATWASSTVATSNGVAGEPSTATGTWRIETNDEYSESLGAFFVRTFETQNGERVEGAVVSELFTASAGMLAFSPLIRAEPAQ